MLDMDELFFTNSCQVLMADVEKEAYEPVYGVTAGDGATAEITCVLFL